VDKGQAGDYAARDVRGEGVESEGGHKNLGRGCATDASRGVKKERGGAPRNGVNEEQGQKKEVDRRITGARSRDSERATEKGGN